MDQKPDFSNKRRKPQIAKWVLFLLAALVVFIAVVLFIWFMSGE